MAPKAEHVDAVRELARELVTPRRVALDQRVQRAISDDGLPRLELLDGLRLQSPDGTVWTLRMSDAGVLYGEGVTVGGSTVIAAWANITGKPSTFPPSAHTHAASQITSGTLNVARIPSLPASQITSGTLATARIPSLPASKISDFDAAARGAVADRAVHADWYSDPQDAVAAAGPGGIVRFAADTTYTRASGDPLTVLMGTALIGEDRHTTVLPRIATSDTGSQIQDVRIENVAIDGDGAAAALDARYLSRCNFDLVRAYNAGSGGAAILFGGDQATDIGGWSNTLSRSEASAPVSGAAVRLAGTVSSSGNAVANFITIWGCTLYDVAGGSGIALDIVNGEGSLIHACDLGYNDGIAIKLGSQAYNNTFVGLRTENVRYPVVIAGGYRNSFVGCSLLQYQPRVGVDWPVTITSGARNAFVLTRYSNGALYPYISEASTGLETIVIDHDLLGSNQPGAYISEPHSSHEWRAFVAKMRDEAEPRWVAAHSGAQQWGSGAAAPDVEMYRSGANTLTMADGDSFRVQGSWNGGKQWFGGYCLWISAAGKLRMKWGEPTADTDGVVIGP